MDYDVINSEELDSFAHLLDGYELEVNKLCIGAWSDDIPVGIVVLEQMEENLVLDYIYVDEAYRRRQVGREMFFKIKNIAGKLHAKIINGDFSATEDFSDDLTEFLIAIKAEARYIRIPYYELNYDDIERALDESSMDFDSDMEVKSLRQMPDKLFKSMIEGEEKSGNYLVSRYDFLKADPDRSFYLKQGNEVTFLVITEPGEDARKLSMPILWSKNKKSTLLMEFLLQASNKLKEASIPTESIRMDLVSPESLKLATHIFGKDKLQYTENITWWMVL